MIVCLVESEAATWSTFHCRRSCLYYGFLGVLAMEGMLPPVAAATRSDGRSASSTGMSCCRAKAEPMEDGTFLVLDGEVCMNLRLREAVVKSGGIAKWQEHS